MHVRHILPVLLALTLASAGGAQTSKDASFGTWPYLVGNMDPQIPTLVAAARNNDLDTIYVSVFRATGPASGSLWVDDAPGTWNPAWGPVRSGGKGIDLVALVSAAHAANLQVVGVVKCFDDTVQPTSAAHRAYLLQVIDYLVHSYDTSGQPVFGLDGLALDYIRYVSSGCSGKDPTLVTDFLREIKERLGALQLHAYLLAGRFTLHGPNYTGPFNTYTSVVSTNRNCYGQDWEQMCRYVDVMMPMAYTANGSIYNTHAEHQAYVRQVAAYCRLACQRGGFAFRRVVPAIRCWNDGSETATPQTVDASITGALAGGGDGYNAFRYATTQSSWWPVLKSYAFPGPNRPLADLQVSMTGASASLDGTASVDFEEPSSALQVRFDLDNDGSFETAWLSNTQPSWLLTRGPGVQRFGMQVRDAEGHVGATVRSVTGPDFLSASPPWVSTWTGGSVQLDVDAGPAAAGLTYLVTGSLSGSAPGTVLAPGLVLPLNIDGLTLGLIQAVNTPLLQNGLVTLDSQGRATSVFSVPPGVLRALTGQTITWAGLAVDVAGEVALVTNASPLWLGL